MAKKNLSTKTKTATTTTTKARKIKGATKEAIDPETKYKLVAELAYKKFLERDKTEGDEMTDWLNAEVEVEKRVRS